MSAPDDGGGPAFPVIGRIINGDRETIYEVPGASMRDYFAAAALTGFMMQEDERTFPGKDPQNNLDAVKAWRAAILKADCEYVFAVADAMLTERAKRKDTP